MSDEQSPKPAEGIRPGEAPAVGANDRVAPGRPPATRPAPATVPPRPKAPPETKDGTREIIETVVFVVVLVLLLKTFLAEAFVIPTGSMAPTLLGYHKQVTCQQCGYPFAVNASDEVEKKGPEVEQATCPNCHFPNQLKARMRGNGP